MVSLIVNLTGPDRPGLVEALSQAIRNAGGNWESSRMARLSGQFAGMVHVVIPDSSLADLEARLQNLEGSEMHISITKVKSQSDATGDDSAGERCQLEVVGQDRIGIVSSITSLLAAAGVNVIEFETDCVDAPISGGRLFKATASLVIPPGLHPDELQSNLESIGSDLMVEVVLSCPVSN